MAFSTLCVIFEKKARFSGQPAWRHYALDRPTDRCIDPSESNDELSCDQIVVRSRGKFEKTLPSNGKEIFYVPIDFYFSIIQSKAHSLVFLFENTDYVYSNWLQKSPIKQINLHGHWEP